MITWLGLEAKVPHPCGKCPDYLDRRYDAKGSAVKNTPLNDTKLYISFSVDTTNAITRILQCLDLHGKQMAWISLDKTEMLLSGALLLHPVHLRHLPPSSWKWWAASGSCWVHHLTYMTSGEKYPPNSSLLGNFISKITIWLLQSMYMWPQEWITGTCCVPLVEEMQRLQ